MSLDATLARRIAVLERLRVLLVEDLKVRSRPGDIDPDTPLFGTGLQLDSIDAVELLISVEQAFDLRVGESAFGPRALRTLNTLVDFVLKEQRDVD